MKKIFIAMLVGASLFVVGCGKNETPKSDKANVSNNEQESKTDDKKEEKAKPTEKKYLEAGEVFTAENERGTYEFKVIEAKYLGAHDGDTNGTLKVQVIWEVNNISFNGQLQDFNGNITAEGVVGIKPEDLKVKDNNGYILDRMSSAWEGDWSNQDVIVKIGEKAIQKFTWILNSEDIEYVYVSYSRMDDENMEFKIQVNK